MNGDELYQDLKSLIQAKEFTLVECRTMLNNYYKFKQISDAQYEELMELSKTLDVNNPDDEKEIYYIQLEKRIEEVEKKIESIESQLESGGSTEEPDPEEPVQEELGTINNPIPAYRGMTYYKGKYYSQDGQTYLCIRDKDGEEEGQGLALNYLPSELLLIYFTLVS